MRIITPLAYTTHYQSWTHRQTCACSILHNIGAQRYTWAGWPRHDLNLTNYLIGWPIFLLIGTWDVMNIKCTHECSPSGTESLSLQFIMQPGTSLDVVLHEKSFPEPRLIIFSDENRVREAQAFIIAEKEVLFEIDSFSVCDALISLIAAYYVFFVSYPKSCTASGLLLFIQEVLLGSQDVSTKKTSKYTALINRVLSD